MPTAAQLQKVFDGQSSTGDSTSYNWPGGIGQFSGFGTWDSASLKMQYSPDDGTTWIDCSGSLTLTDDGVANFELGPCDIRASLTVTGTSAITCWMAVRHGATV